MRTAQPDVILLQERSADFEYCQSLLAEIQSAADNHADTVESDPFRVAMSLNESLLPHLELVCYESNGDEPASRKLFAKPGDPVASVKPEAVVQGGVGNCYFMAALSSLAQVNPMAIVDMIKDNGDGTYTVTFPGASDEPITVLAPTEYELSRFAAAGPHGTWPAVMEKAYGVYRSQSTFQQCLPLSYQDSNYPQEATDGGSSHSAGLAILTGGDVEMVSSASTREAHAALTKAFKEGRPATAYIHKELFSLFFGGNNLTADAGIPRGHEYSVLSYNPETGIVTIRNPWGRGEPMGRDEKPRDGLNDGVFNMTLEEFKLNFSGLALAGN